MRRKTFRVLFFLKKSKLMKNGEAPICMRITVDGKTSDIQIKRSAPVEHWNQPKECVRGKGRNVEELNRYIEATRVRLYQIYRELEENNKVITAERIKNIYYGNGETQRTLLQVFAEHNAQCQQLIGKDYVFKTVQRYESTVRYLKEFMQRKYKLSDIALTELTPSFIHEFDIFLKVEKQNTQNAAVVRLKHIKKMVRIALENDWIKKSPFTGIKFKQEETNPEFLTIEEIQTITAKNFTIGRIEQVRDIYLFCCMTGLAFTDVQQLSAEHIVKGQDGELWIRKARQKTKNMCNIPLLPLPIKLIEKYANHPECVKNGRLFPVPSNQKMNAYLREIADLCGINKRLTTHTARHSYATSVCLANGVSMENVAKMLGHSDTTMTKHYARVLDTSILRDMQKVKSLFSA